MTFDSQEGAIKIEWETGYTCKNHIFFFAVVWMMLALRRLFILKRWCVEDELHQNPQQSDLFSALWMYFCLPLSSFSSTTREASPALDWWCLSKAFHAFFVNPLGGNVIRYDTSVTRQPREYRDASVAGECSAPCATKEARSASKLLGTEDFSCSVFSCLAVNAQICAVKSSPRVQQKPLSLNNSRRSALPVRVSAKRRCHWSPSLGFVNPLGCHFN